jgi:hypothetical protein
VGVRGEDGSGGDGGVRLPEGLTGSGFLHRLLVQAVERYPDELGCAELPESPGEFKRRYAELLVRFEALRAGSTRRSEIARSISEQTHAELEFEADATTVPLREQLSRPAEPVRLERIDGTGSPGLVPSVLWGERRYSGAELCDLGDRMREDQLLTRAAASGLDWLARHSLEGDGRLRLAGEKFVVLGAGAEIAPTPLLLAAGADVLWIDLQDPAALLARRGEFGGRLHVPIDRDETDLLARPGRVAATIAAFAAGDPVHLGLFAYAPGESQEWRLAASMNAIVRSLDPALVRSVSLFVSPTAPLVLEPEDVAAAESRAGLLPSWQSGLVGLGMLDSSGPYTRDGVHVARAIVPLQGLSYQGAQYVSKILAAESFAIHGTAAASGAERAAPVTLSANVAGITATRSMRHPVFQAAFLGASQFGVHVFEPETTRALSGLLLLRDLLDPEAPGSVRHAAAEPQKRAARLFSQQVHGGLYSAPFRLEPTLRVAAVLGLARRPRLLLDLF